MRTLTSTRSSSTHRVRGTDLLHTSMNAVAALLPTKKPPLHPNSLRRAQTYPRSGRSKPIPLLVLIFTTRGNTARRAAQRAAWLRLRWSLGDVVSSRAAGSNNSSSWRYVYMMAQDEASAVAIKNHPLDTVVGDGVTLSAVREGYANLVLKTMEALRWALRYVQFTTLLKTDDDSIVHIGRVTQWLQEQRRLRAPASFATLYAGRVFRDSQVIRANFTRANLLHPEWFPPDFTKWAVPYSALSTSSLVSSLFYPPYCSGGGYFLGTGAARRIVAAFDARQRRGVPVIEVEDAYVGILAQENDLQPTDLSDSVQDPPAHLRQAPSLYAGQFLVHRVDDFERAADWIRLRPDGAGPRPRPPHRKSSKRRRNKAPAPGAEPSI